MLDSKQIKAYNSIKAPNNLLDKITAQKPAKKRFNYKALVSVAACVLLLAAILPTYLGMSAPSVAIAPAQATFARSFNKSITLSLETHRETSVTVSEGDIGISGEEKIKGETELVWVLGDIENKDHTLTLTDMFGETEYTLQHNANNDSWSIVKK